MVSRSPIFIGSLFFFSLSVLSSRSSLRGEKKSCHSESLTGRRTTRPGRVLTVGNEFCHLYCTTALSCPRWPTQRRATVCTSSLVSCVFVPRGCRRSNQFEFPGVVKSYRSWLLYTVTWRLNRPKKLSPKTQTKKGFVFFSISNLLLTLLLLLLAHWCWQ